ncbi:DUF1214 domain-containing protein [Phenylobacterium sp.]|uniref:DUF1214 domain-containing protein n=1 Tax=Phenylobacterium sp. TaxID=1871053 RepID=UPI00301C6EA8
MAGPDRRGVMQALGVGVAMAPAAAGASGHVRDEVAKGEAAGDEVERFAREQAAAFAETYRAVTERNFDVHRAAVRKAGAGLAEITMLDCALNTARAASMGAIFTMEWDPAYPMLGKLLTMSRGIPGRPNADAHYHIASLHSDYTYHIRGDRGTALIFDAIVHAGSMATRNRPLVDSLGLRRIEIPPGEEIDIVLSREPRDGLSLKLPEGDCFLYLRQYFYDWDTEEPARLVIEREGAVFPPPQPTRAVMARRFEMMNGWLSSNQDVASSDTYKVFDLPPNTLEPFTFATGAFANVQYICGYSVCRANEALIIEFEQPRARYWSINLNDAYGGALHPHMRQSTLNGHQAQMDSDGRFRLVIAQSDPGVANWLDSNGRDLTTLGVRLHDSEGAPPFALKLVPLNELERHLPAGTARVSPEARQQALRRRLLSAYRRGVTDF